MYGQCSFKDIARATSRVYVSNFFSSNLVIAALGYVARKFTVIPLRIRLRVTARMMQLSRKDHPGTMYKGEIRKMTSWIAMFISLRFTRRRNHST